MAPFMEFNEMAIRSFERAARHGYETAGEALEFSLSQARAVLAAKDPQQLATKQAELATQFLNRQAEALNCTECHGKHEGFPAWELLGGKLKTEWAAAFISGKDTRKPRPWLEARMPAFPAYAPFLAEGLSTRHGQPVKSVADTASVAEDAGKGRKLVSAQGGFSCISCHGIADFGATAVFEAPGINLAH
jgi:mono/diheme cytochrome c family protein